MEEVRAGVVAHRGGSPLGIDLGRDRVADRDLPAQRAAMDDQPRRLRSGNALRVLDLEGDVPASASPTRSTPRSPTWPPPSG